MISDDWKERIGYRAGHVGPDVGSGTTRPGRATFTKQTN